MSFVSRPRAAQAAARLLLESGCVRADLTHSAQLRYGLCAPLRLDIRPLQAHPRIRASLVEFAVTMLHELALAGEVEAVACCSGAATVFASDLADRLRVPVLGPAGAPDPGGRAVLLVDDFLVSGRTKVALARRLRALGLQVAHGCALLDFDLQGARCLLTDAGLSMHALTDWQVMVEAACRTGRCDAGVERELQSFVQDPRGWSARRRGGAQRVAA